MNKKALLVAAGVCGLVVSGQAQTGPAPVAWYKFDEGAGALTAANAVGGSSTGAIKSSVITGAAGISGNAYQFDGTVATSFVDMGNANFFSSINTAQKLTFSTWIKTTATTGARRSIVFAGNNTVANSYTDIGFSPAGDTNAPAITAGKAYDRNRVTGNGTSAFNNSSASVNDGNWHQLVMTLDLSAASNQLLLYVDGSLTNSQTLSGGNLAFPVFNTFQVGRLGRMSPTDAYSGLIDDVQVYSSALTSAQVSWLFNNPGLALTAIPEPSAYAWGVAALCGTLVLIRRRAEKNASLA